MTQEAAVASNRNLAPPWRERLPSGDLGAEYGPRTASTYARQVAEFKNWAHQAPKSERKGSAEVMAYMTLEDGSVREDVPESELMVFRLVFQQGHSVRWVARHKGLRRDTVKSYVKRLRAKAAEWAREQEPSQR